MGEGETKVTWMHFFVDSHFYRRITTIAMPIYMFMLYLLELEKTKQNSILFIISGISGVLIKEDVIVVMAAIGLWALFLKKNYNLEGLIIFFFNILAFFWS